MSATFQNYRRNTDKLTIYINDHFASGLRNFQGNALGKSNKENGFLHIRISGVLLTTNPLVLHQWLLS